MAGLTAANLLQSAGWRVLILDKGRGVGGRMATRRIGDQRLDHGAQFFTVRDAAFAKAVARWQHSGWVEPWFETGGHIRHRAVDGMAALARHLARDLDVRTSERIVHLEARDRWQITTEAGARYDADLLVLTMPAPQTLDLLAPVAIPGDMREQLKAIDFDPCLALLVTADGESRVPEPGFVRPSLGPAAWIADNRRKQISDGAVALTLHATPAFSREYLERPADAEAILRQAAAQWFEGTAREVHFHRWRYSQPSVIHAGRCVSATQPARLIVAGDAFGAPRVEGAFLSGVAAAQEAL